jgi:hypothetical protein
MTNFYLQSQKGGRSPKSLRVNNKFFTCHPEPVEGSNAASIAFINCSAFSLTAMMLSPTIKTAKSYQEWLLVKTPTTVKKLPEMVVSDNTNNGQKVFT